MPREIEARLRCEQCNDMPYTVYRMPAVERGGNEGVFLNWVEPEPPEGVEIRCPMCTGPLVRV